MADPQESQVSALQGVTFEGGELASLLNKEFKPKTDEAKSAVEQAVLTLAQQALSQTKLISGDVLGSIEGMIAEIENALKAVANGVRSVTIKHSDNLSNDTGTVIR